MKRHISSALALAALLALGVQGSAQALTFNFTFTASTTLQQQQAFIDAGNRWSALFSDSIVLDMTVGVESLGTGVLASTGSRRASYSYGNYLTALTGDRTSASDFTAVGSLPTGSSFGLLINRTLDNPNGAGSATPYVDNFGANNTTINLTTANAKALGLNPGTGTVGVCTSTCDASIRFGTAFTWDYDPSNGISAGAFDFVGIATHEIGHALGFVSGVDILDINSSGTFFNADQFTFVNSLDLFRYSSQSLASGVRDFTADTRAKFFSINGGATQVGLLSLGRTWGDGQQASHWKDSLGLGIMDPTAGQGERLAISGNDVLAFDVIGWNLAAVPEPQTYALFALGLVAIGWRLRGHRQS
jgi:PEP-CTERM motif